MSKALAIFGGSTLVYAILAILMGVLPGIWLSQVPPTPGLEPLTPLEAHGRDVYVSEGCFYCHTQQVRPLSGDGPFGRPSAPGDYAYQTPELLGSERNGPDLSNIGVRQSSSVWQYIHLFEPRAVVPQSIMPAYPWLFKVVDKAPQGEQPVPLPAAVAPTSGVVIPNDDGKALVAYLLSLKQPRIVPVAAPGAPAPAPAATGEPGFDADKGATLFANNCASCHGADGKGVPGAFPALAGDPVVNAADPVEHIGTVLHGAQGRTIGGQTYAAQMPAFAEQLSDADIADIINHERTSWGNHGPLVNTATVAAVRLNKPPPTGALPGTATSSGAVGATTAGGATASTAAPARTERSAATQSATFDAAQGAKLFADHCAACHGAEGKGVAGAFPPLAGDPVVNAADAGEHIDTVLRGVQGRTINGQTYASPMPPFADQLSDPQIADIIGHERTSWGNHAPLVTPADVAKRRAAK